MVDFSSKKILLKKNRIIGSIIYLEPRSSIDPLIFSRLTQEELKQIFCEVDISKINKLNKLPWNVFFNLVNINDKSVFGFIWVIINHDIELDVSIHGGGWESSLAKGRFYLDSLFTLLKHLKCYFKVIRTSCKTENVRAKKIIERSGFVFSHKKNNFNYFILESNILKK